MEGLRPHLSRVIRALALGLGAVLWDPLLPVRGHPWVCVHDGTLKKPQGESWVEATLGS